MTRRREQATAASAVGRENCSSAEETRSGPLLSDSVGGSVEEARGSLDRRRLHDLLERSLSDLKAFLRARVGPALRARVSHTEIMQSVCREVLAQAEQLHFRDDAAFRNWLYTAALHRVIEEGRKQHAARRDVRREVSIDADDGIDADVLQGYATAITPSVIAMGREGATKLEAAFDELSEEHREIITLARIVGLSHAEIAAQLGKSEDACRQLLRRAIVKLSLHLSARGITI